MEVRDKLFTEEQYLKQLSRYAARIIKFEDKLNRQKGLSQKNLNNGILSPYDILFDCKLRTLLTLYSMGEDIGNLKKNYNQVVELMKVTWLVDGGYYEMLWMLSIGIILDYENDIILDLVKLIEKENVDDYIYNLLIKAKFPDWKKKSDSILYPVPYQGISSITNLVTQDKKEAVKRLERYLKKEWYRGHSDCYWYNDHKYGIEHDGYWSFESGALVKIFGLDDSSLKNCPYYPYDMVHWNEK